jgi:hypothetical protein
VLGSDDLGDTGRRAIGNGKTVHAT